MKPLPTYRPLIWLFVVVVAVWLLFGVVLFPYSRRGDFGDMFGAVNALFSGLAFAGIIFAIHLQREELAQQRRELELTRYEMEGQKEAITAQNITLTTQRFENKFFQLLNLLNAIVTATDLERGTNKQTARGRDAMFHIYRRLSTHYHQRISTPPLPTDEHIRAAYHQFYLENRSDLGHYFRLVYNIVKFIHQSAAQDKKFYTNILRAQLSDQELALLFYNCIAHPEGRENFLPLAEEYQLFNNLSPRTLIDPGHAILVAHLPME